MGRFLSVDPGDDSDPLNPQSWNQYTYTRNNPLIYLDPDGETAVKYLVRGIAKGYRAVKRSVAVRKAASSSHAVRVVGPGASKKARGIVKDAHPGRGTVRHDHGGSHWQPKKSVKKNGKNVGQVHYTVEGVVGTVAALGATAGAAMEDATGSELLGQATQTLIDFFNPATDIQEAASLITEIGTDIIESVQSPGQQQYQKPQENAPVQLPEPERDDP